jgi:putative flavoprotein involved in K+ transport
MTSKSLPVVVIGGGQAGLSASWRLKARGVEHVVLEKHSVGHAWRTQRWDSFCLVTPNRQCRLPDFPYAGSDPDGFMLRDEIVAYVEAFAAHVRPPLHEGGAATRIGRRGDGFVVETDTGDWQADAVILAVSGYHKPRIPRLAERLPAHIVQHHSSTYRNPDSLPPGEVLVVGSAQSGCQIAEDLHLAGRKVHLAVGSAPRSPRRYRGRDALDWLEALGQYDLDVMDHPLGEAVRKKANHYFSGRGGGREIDLRRFAVEGMALHGRLNEIADGKAAFIDDLAKNLDAADAAYLKIQAMIDDHIAAQGIDAPPAPPYLPCWAPPEGSGPDELPLEQIGAVIWATGFEADWGFIDLPAFDGQGHPVHRRGVTCVPGLYVLGLPWLHTWGSGRFSAVGRDAAYVVDHLWAARLSGRAASPSLVPAEA